MHDMIENGSTADEPGAGSSKPRRLLIVEDEAVIRFVLKCELEQNGFTVVEVGDGRQALEAFRTEPHAWAGAFVDYLLPDTHGDELIDAFLELRPDLPVVLMTGDFDPDTERLARERDLPILRKPFPLERVRPLVANMIQDTPNAHPDGCPTRTEGS